jgi:signal transduction histidine kinase
LEPKGLEGSELKTALKSVLLTSGEDQQARFSIQIDASAARELDTMQATEVFNIAKEAMSNAMRHANAGLTTVSLVPRGRDVRLEVADDGIGFDSQAANGESLGLHNMRKRAHNIGAHLEVISAPGTGTRVILDIPTSPHDSN